MDVNEVSRKLKELDVNVEEQRTYYNHLKVMEFKKMSDKFCFETQDNPLYIDYREEVINRLVLLSDRFDLVPETIYSAVGYMDRYHSGNVVECVIELLLVGVSCFIIASKYGQASHPSIEDICEAFYYDIGEFEKEEVIKMEMGVMHFLKFELKTPSAKDFLQYFVDAVISEEMKGDSNDERALRFRSLTDYISELHLLDYTMIQFSPSMVAASTIFLGKFILRPYRNSWSSTLKNLTEYDASDLKYCIEKLHSLYRKNYEHDGDSVRHSSTTSSSHSITTTGSQRARGSSPKRSRIKKRELVKLWFVVYVHVVFVRVC